MFHGITYVCACVRMCVSVSVCAVMGWIKTHAVKITLINPLNPTLNHLWKQVCCQHQNRQGFAQHGGGGQLHGNDIELLTWNSSSIVPVFKFRLRWIPLGLVSWHVPAPFFLFLYIPLTIFSNPFLQVPPEIPSTFHGFKLGLSTFISKSQLNKHRLTSLQVPNPLTHPTFLHFWDSKIIYSNINCLEATTSYFTSYLIHTSYSSFASLSPDLLGPAMMSLCNHQSLVNQYAYNQDH